MVDDENEERGDIVMALRQAGYNHQADEVGTFTIEDARAAYERIMGRPWVMVPTLQTARVVLDITFDRRITTHPALWNWHDLLVSEASESVRIVSVD